MEDADETASDATWELETPSAYIPLTEGASCLRAPWSYLAKRGIDRQTATSARIGYADTGRHRFMLVLPIWDAEQKWVGWVGKSIARAGRQARTNHTARGFKRGEMFYGEHLMAQRASHGPLVVTEGPFDALALWGRAVACLGKPTRVHRERLTALARIRPLIIMLDGDAWRTGAALAFGIRQLGGKAISVRLPPAMDLGDLGRTQQAERLWPDLVEHSEKNMDVELRVE